MDWVSNLFVVLLLADVAGTVFFLISELIKRTPFGLDIRFQRFLTDATLCAFFVPFVYIVYYLDKRIHVNGLESEVNLFYTTPWIGRLNTVLGCIWFGAFLVLLLYRLCRRHRWTMVCKGNIPEEDGAVSRVFERVSKELGVSGKVSLCRNDSVRVPCITYHHGSVVILPLHCYTEEEAEIIFYHELCHYLNHDLLLKALGRIATLLHALNPTAYILLAQMDLLCEKSCDMTACKKGKVTFTHEEYFQKIMDMLLMDGRRGRYQLFAIAGGTSSYERRVKYMADYHKHGGMKKSTAFVVAALFLFGSSTSALAAGNGVANAYQELAEHTIARSEQGIEVVDVNSGSDSEMDTLMMRPNDLDPDKVIMTDDVVNVGPGREFRNITWTIPPEYTFMTAGFDVNKGDTMVATIVPTPDDLEYETGFKDGKNYMHYEYVEGIAAIKYTVDSDKRHYFYISNWSETEELHIEATVMVTPEEPEETE